MKKDLFTIQIQRNNGVLTSKTIGTMYRKDIVQGLSDMITASPHLFDIIMDAVSLNLTGDQPAESAADACALEMKKMILNS